MKCLAASLYRICKSSEVAIKDVDEMLCGMLQLWWHCCSLKNWNYIFITSSFTQYNTLMPLSVITRQTVQQRVQ
jgi:hypothetical protein